MYFMVPQEFPGSDQTKMFVNFEFSLSSCPEVFVGKKFQKQFNSMFQYVVPTKSDYTWFFKFSILRERDLLFNSWYQIRKILHRRPTSEGRQFSSTQGECQVHRPLQIPCSVVWVCFVQINIKGAFKFLFENQRDP